MSSRDFLQNVSREGDGGDGGRRKAAITGHSMCHIEAASDTGEGRVGRDEGGAVKKAIAIIREKKEKTQFLSPSEIIKVSK